MKNSVALDQNFSITRTLLWALFLAFGIQIFIGLIVGFVVGVTDVQSDSTEEFFNQPYLIAVIGFIAAACSMPFLKPASKQTNTSSLLSFLAIKSISTSTLIKVLLLGFVYYALAMLLGDLLSIETPEFMLDIKQQSNSILDITFLILGICLIAPVVEEVIFRGLIYQRLLQSKAGVLGAIIITSLVFTAIHIQYDVLVLAILSLFALLLGVVRYKTNNLFYCIALHMQLNALSTIELFLFV